MELLNCPQCKNSRIGVIQKEALTIDGKEIECKKCDARISVNRIYGMLSLFMFFFSFYFSFPIFMGNTGFVFGAVLSFVFSTVIYLILSFIAPIRAKGIG